MPLGQAASAAAAAVCTTRRLEPSGQGTLASEGDPGQADTGSILEEAGPVPSGLTMCSDVMRDPFSLYMVGYLGNAMPFRGCSRMTTVTFQQAVDYDFDHLEMPWPTATWHPGSSNSSSDTPQHRVPIHALKLDPTGGWVAWSSPEVPWRSTAELHVDNIPGLTKIDSWFAADCPNLLVASFRNLRGLTKIGDFCLRHGVAVQEVSFTDLPVLTSVGSYCMTHLRNLRRVVLEDLPRLGAIGDGWLTGCGALTEFTLTGLPALTRVGSHFMVDCKRIMSVSITRLPKLQSIGDSFLISCASLQVVTLSDLPELTTVGSGISHNPVLERVTMVRLPKLETIRTHPQDGLGMSCPLFQGATLVHVPNLAAADRDRVEKTKPNVQEE